MYPILRKAVFLLIIFLPLFSYAQTDLYVATTGDNSGPNDCQTMGSPCLTITHTISQSTDGDNINIANGTYDESVAVNTNLNFITTNSPDM